MVNIKDIFTMKRLKDIINKSYGGIKVEIYPRERDMFIVTGLPNGKLKASPGAAIEELLRVVRTCKINNKAPIIATFGDCIIVVPTGEYREGKDTHEIWAAMECDSNRVLALGSYISLWKMMSFFEKQAIDKMVEANPVTMH